jgi:hypothetical protein
MSPVDQQHQRCCKTQPQKISTRPIKNLMPITVYLLNRQRRTERLSKDKGKQLSNHS